MQLNLFFTSIRYNKVKIDKPPCREDLQEGLPIFLIILVGPSRSKGCFVQAPPLKLDHKNSLIEKCHAGASPKLLILC